MDRLDAMELFAAAVDGGSLAAAARRLGRSAAGATRAVALLEEAAGETLLLRSTRGLRLTAAGERHLAVWRDVLERLAGEAHTKTPGTVAGQLVVTAPELFGRLQLMPILSRFLATHPDVQARALLLDRVVDLVGEGVDVAVRLAPLQDTSLAAVKIGELRRLVCAAPDHLGAHGVPQQPTDLTGHVCIGLDTESDRQLWRFRRERHGHQERSLQVRTRLVVNSVPAAHDAARRGEGFVRAFCYQVAEDIAAGRLVAVLTDFEPKATLANLLFRAKPRRWSPTRAFVDEAVPQFRQALAKMKTLINAGARQQKTRAK